MKPENNTGLVEYGIEDETTDYRAHVCPLVRRVYVFETKSGIEAVKESGLESVAVYSACAKHWGHKPDCPICSGKGKVLTALGFPVPVTTIPGVVEVSLPREWWEKAGIDESQSTSEKGDRAVRIVAGMIKTGRFPFMVSQEFITDRDIQISAFGRVSGGGFFVVHDLEGNYIISKKFRGVRPDGKPINLKSPRVKVQKNQGLI